MHMQGNENVTEVVDPIQDNGEELNDLTTGCIKTSKARTKLLRKEQISQGVLHRMLKTLGRVTFEQVATPRFHIRSPILSSYNVFCVHRILSSSSILSAAPVRPASLLCAPAATSSALTTILQQW
jgi:hypothetical protein